MKVVAGLLIVVLSAFAALAQSSDLLERAKAGDIDSQLKLANNYQFGVDGPKDMSRAIEWFRKAGSLGSSSALAARITDPPVVNGTNSSKTERSKQIEVDASTPVRSSGEKTP